MILDSRKPGSIKFVAAALALGVGSLTAAGFAMQSDIQFSPTETSAATSQDNSSNTSQAKLTGTSPNTSFDSSEVATRFADVENTGTIPTPLNAEVVRELIKYTSTAAGREYMRESLERRKKYAPTVAKSIAKYNLPPELSAIPIIESGYVNRSPVANPRHGAGIWMFIAPTAKNFGLIVSPEIDQRLNVELETDAAMRLFAYLNLQFQNWPLALLAYNIGAKKAAEGIRQTSSNNAWDLVAAGYENDKNYLAKVTAAILISKNQKVLDTP